MKMRFVLPLLFFFIIIVILWRGLHLSATPLPSPLIGKPAPAYSLPTLAHAKTTSEKDLRGQITLLNVWATWCETCVMQHDFLLSLAHENGFRLYGFLYKDDPIAAKKWLNNHGNPYYIVAVDQTGKAAIDWGVYGTPETFVIDKKGIIRYKITGPITSENWESTIKPLIATLGNEA